MSMQFFQRRADQIIIAVPSKGRLRQHVMGYLAKRGFEIDEDSLGRKLQTNVVGMEDHLVALIHPKDIPLFLEKGVVDVGFTGLDLIHETKAMIRPLIRMGIGHVKMALLVPKESNYSHPFHLMGKKVGTPFPSIAKAYFENLKVDCKVQLIQGASEGMPYLGIVDAIVDVVETARSAEENELKVIDDEIFYSECICAVRRPEFQSNYKKVNEFLRRLYDETN